MTDHNNLVDKAMNAGVDLLSWWLPGNGARFASSAWEYWLDSIQRSVLFADVMRERGNIFVEHEEAGNPPVLSFDYETLIDGRDLEKPVNYFLLRILPPPGMEVDQEKRPFVVVDPRAGHGPGIGGSKSDSQIGAALKAGHPCYFIGFHPEPCPGQTVGRVAKAEGIFLEHISARHPSASGKPCIMANCQAGWAMMGLSTIRPELPGPLVLSGSPVAYWAGLEGGSPMRYLGGVLGGAWPASFAGDMGNGIFDGAHLVANFELHNPANTYWKKPYHLYSNIDTEAPRFLSFEKWWGGYFFMTTDEIRFIISSLFVSNRLSTGNLVLRDGRRMDLRNIRSPIVVFASHGDDITAPQQALNWILDVYESVDEIRAREQTIVYILHETIGHLGIFVSARVARREHSQFVDTLDLIDTLVPGLYEMIIEKKDPEDPTSELVQGDYVVRFEDRTLDDIRALDDGRQDEEPFEVVSRISEINEGLYRELVSPYVRACVNDFTAEWQRRLHPNRVSYEIFSDGNPSMSGVKTLAQVVRANRRPASRDNPFRIWERTASSIATAWLESYGNARGLWREWLFNSMYSSSWVQAIAGMRSWFAAAPKPRVVDEARNALTELKIRDIKKRIDHGGPVEATIRMLLYIGLEDASCDIRSFARLQRIRQEYPNASRLSQEEFKAVFKEQFFMLLLDEERALAALPTLIPSPEGRAEALGIVRTVGSAKGQMSPERQRRMEKLERVMEVDWVKSSLDSC